MWPANKLTDLLGIEYPIIQAPMAGAATPELAADLNRSLPAAELMQLLVSESDALLLK